MAAPRRTSRSYRNDLRAKQSAATRAAIIVALTAELARSHESGEELSLARVAATAGVSLRTVYHHFPDRHAQLAAVEAHLDTSTTEPYPSALGEVPAYAARAAHTMLSNTLRLHAEIALGRQTSRRDLAIVRAVAKQSDAATAKLVGAALSTVMSSEAALALLARLDATQAETTMVWMAQVLVDAVRNGDVPASGFKRTRRS